jgi:hypothetical protein
MLKSFLTAAAVSALLSMSVSTSALACGCTPPPPPSKVKVKANSGVGNGGEPRGVTGELNDRDPGNSGAHNQAFKNQSKPQSAAGRMP